MCLKINVKIPTKIVVGFLCLAALSTQAQDYIRQGYIIKNDGDTLKGFIHDVEWGESPRFVTFQASKDASTEEYTIDLIKAFYIARPAYYERYTIKYDADKMQDGDYPSTREPSNWAEATILLQRIVNGGTSLFYFSESSGRSHYFIKTPGTAPEELLDRTYKVTGPDGGTYLKKAEKWKQQLINYSMDCPSLRSRIMGLQYDQTPLTRIIESINQCKGQETVQLTTDSKQKKKKPLVGFFGQAFLPHVNLDSYPRPTSTGDFAGGISYEFFSNRRPNRVSFYSELKYQHANSSVTDYGGTHNITTKSYLMINMIRFSYPVKGNRLFWNGGIANGYRSEFKITPAGFSPYTQPVGPGMETGLAAGIGMGLFNSKRIKSSLELRYELHISFSSPVTTNLYGLILGVQF